MPLLPLPWQLHVDTFDEKTYRAPVASPSATPGACRYVYITLMHDGAVYSESRSGYCRRHDTLQDAQDWLASELA
jgi:hypothetical protein